jgi:hypothetical protein
LHGSTALGPLLGPDRDAASALRAVARQASTPAACPAPRSARASNDCRNDMSTWVVATSNPASPLYSVSLVCTLTCSSQNDAPERPWRCANAQTHGITAAHAGARMRTTNPRAAVGPQDRRSARWRRDHLYRQRRTESGSGNRLYFNPMADGSRDRKDCHPGPRGHRREPAITQVGPGREQPTARLHACECTKWRNHTIPWPSACRAPMTVSG